MTRQPHVIGMVWYRQEEYARFRKLFRDGRKLPPTYKQWLKQANKGLEQLTAQGHLVEKVYLDLDTFPDWRRRRGLDIDADARMRFANEAVARKYRNPH